MNQKTAQLAGKVFFLSLCAVFWLTACGTAPSQNPELRVINVSATAATEPWLPNVYACAEAQSLVIRRSAPEAADLRLQLGEPETMATPIFQIGSETLVVVTEPESPLQALTLEQVRDLFSRAEEGQGPQLWVYAAGEDLQQVFVRQVMRGRPVSSLARIALSSQAMIDQLSQAHNALGFLPLHGLSANLKEVFRLPISPVLAIPSLKPPEGLGTLLACLQQKTAP